MDNNEGNMIKDTSLYMLAKGIEGLVGFITIIIYTYYFVPEKYGIYNIINSTVVTSAFFILNWLSQSLLRYIEEYSLRNELEQLYSTVLTIWFVLTAATVIFMIISIFILSAFVERQVFKTLWLMLFMFVFYGANLVLTSILVAQRKIKLNLILSSLSIIFKLLFSTAFIIFVGADIKWIIISNIIFDGLAVIIILFRLQLFKFIKPNLFSKEIFKRFLNYGMPLIGLNFSTSILYNSDRYIIQLLLGAASVGIYYANYSLMSAGFSIILNAVLKATYPPIIKAWNDKDVKRTKVFIGKAVREYLLLAVPALFGIAVLAQSVSKLILNEAYIEGYSVMKWVAFGMVILGLTEYVNKIYELTENTGVIFKNSLISGIINILLNFALLPIFGYKAAAVTTAIGFFVYFILSVSKTGKENLWILDKKVYVRIVFSALIMAVLLKVIVLKVELNLIGLIGLVMLGIFIYGLVLILSGELNEEIKFLKSFLVRK